MPQICSLPANDSSHLSSSSLALSTMNLETAQSISCDAVTEAQLRAAFQDDARRGEFIVLSQDHKQEVYIQAAGEADGPYSLEYRDGDEEHHFQATGDYHKDDVQRAFLWYLAGDTRWRTEFSWQKLERRPWWKFW